MGSGTRAFVITLLALLVVGGVLFSIKDAQDVGDVAESTAPLPRSSNATDEGNETASGNETAPGNATNETAAGNATAETNATPDANASATPATTG